MSNYIDGFALPIPKKSLNEYRQVAEVVADIWKEYGALSYFEYVGDDLKLEGTRSFLDILNVKEDEAVVFGWVTFSSREARDLANKNVMKDTRMAKLINPLMDPERLVFDPKRMVYGGFQSFIQSGAQ